MCYNYILIIHSNYFCSHKGCEVIFITVRAPVHWSIYCRSIICQLNKMLLVIEVSYSVSK